MHPLAENRRSRNLPSAHKIDLLKPQNLKTKSNERSSVKRTTSTLFALIIQNCATKSTTIFNKMVFQMTKSILLAMLAAAANPSSVTAEPATRIVGGSQASPGDYPYFGKEEFVVSRFFFLVFALVQESNT